jgi:glycosyltransferase involved in cell wall biosynthesis
MPIRAGEGPARQLMTTLSQRGPRPNPGAHARAPSPAQPPIRVLMVTARFLPDVGGTETHTYEVARRMALRADLELTVLTTDRSGRRPAREDLDGFTVMRCRSYPRRRDYYFSPGVYRQIINGTYDVIHCQGIHTAVPVLAMAAARRKRTPYVVTLHTGGHSSALRRRLRTTQWRALGPLLRGAAVIVAVSRFEEQVFRKACSLDPARIRIIQNGGDLPASESPAELIPGRIASCGRLEHYKGHQRVIDALPLVQRSVPGATLHILGSGPYEPQLRARVAALGLQESVIFESIDPGDRARMAESLRQACVVAVLSEYESSPVAVLEALTLGVPVVGLDTAGIGDLIKDGLVTGIPQDASPAAIARILVAALPGRRAAVTAGLPTWDAVAARLAHVYLDTLGAIPGWSGP